MTTYFGMGYFRTYLGLIFGWASSYWVSEISIPDYPSVFKIRNLKFKIPNIIWKNLDPRLHSGSSSDFPIRFRHATPILFLISDTQLRSPHTTPTWKKTTTTPLYYRYDIHFKNLVFLFVWHAYSSIITIPKCVEHLRNDLKTFQSLN